MQIGVPTETAPGETRVAVTPETAKKLVAQGHQGEAMRSAVAAARLQAITLAMAEIKPQL